MKRFAYIVTIGKDNKNFKIFSGLETAFNFLRDCYYSAFTGQPINLALSYYTFEPNLINLKEICSRTINEYEGNYKPLAKKLNKQYRLFRVDYSQNTLGIENEIMMQRIELF